MPPSLSLTCWKPFAESVTVLPSPSTTHPDGSGLWLSLYTRTFPAATVVVAMSSSNGALRLAGAANGGDPRVAARSAEVVRVVDRDHTNADVEALVDRQIHPVRGRRMAQRGV